MNIIFSKLDVNLIEDVLGNYDLSKLLKDKAYNLLTSMSIDGVLSIRQRHDIADVLRDMATTLEWLDLVQAHKLMKRALYYRPDGPFLNKKMQQYCRYLEVAKSGLCEVNGVSLSFPKQPPIPLLRSLADGSYENKEAELVAHAIDRNDRVLELGAGVGFMGITVMRCCEPAYYVAYEANPALLSYIHHNQQLNNISFDIHNAVLLEKESTQPFYVTPAFWGSSLLQPKEEEYQQVEVPVLNKHLVIADLLPTVLIIDIEGGESAFFEGLNLNSVMKIIVEIHPQILTDSELTAIYKTLIDAGFLLDFKVSGRQELFWYRSDIKEAV